MSDQFTPFDAFDYLDSVEICHEYIRLLQSKNQNLRAALELYRDAVRIDATMEGPKFMGANTSALKRAWDADRAALQTPTPPEAHND